MSRRTWELTGWVVFGLCAVLFLAALTLSMATAMVLLSLTAARDDLRASFARTAPSTSVGTML